MSKIPPPPAPVLSDELIQRVESAVRGALCKNMLEWTEVVRRDIVDELRFIPLAAELQAARVRRGLELKQAAKLAKLAKYTVVAIESSYLVHLTPQAVERYASALGAEAHWTRWRDAHPELARRLGRAEASALIALIQQRAGGADGDSRLAEPNAIHSKPSAQEGPAQSTRALQLKIVLQDVSPPIWRRVLVTDDLSLHGLHQVIQMAMGWGDIHPYQFDFGDLRFTDAERSDDMEPGEQDSRETLLSALDLRARASFRYAYDFGEGWQHVVTVERREDAAPGAQCPSCLAGERACPPEDCGGPRGYTELQEILADPSHPEHEERRAWAGKEFSPNRFDARQISADMRQVRWHDRK